MLEGLTFLKEFVNILSISSVYKTEPLLYEDQEDFLNIVTEIDYQGTAKSLLLIIKDIEIQMGRKKTFRYGPRIIDIDIIFFKGEEINEEDLIIPHYDWNNRLFVIQPLYELLNKPLNKSNYKIHQQKIIKIGKIEL